MRKCILLLGLAVSAAGAGAAEQFPAELTAANRAALTRQSVSVQQTAAQAENLMREGNQLFLDSKYLEARTRYMDAKRIFESFHSEEFVRRTKVCEERIRECYFLLAEDTYKAADKSLQEKDFEEALNLYREAAKMYPENEARAKAKIAEVEQRKAAASMREKTNMDALVSDRENQQYRIEVLLRQGQELARSGRFADAAQKFNSVLLIDPYHSTALHDLKAANLRSRSEASARTRTNHRKLITEAEWVWATPARAETETKAEELSGPVTKEADAASELEKKIRSIMLPEFKVEKAAVPAVVRALQEQSRLNDPEKGDDSHKGGLGVNIFLRRPSALTPAAPAEGAAEGAEGAGPEAPPAPDPAAAAPAPAPNAAAAEEDEEEEGENNDSKGWELVTMDIRKRSLESALKELCRVAKLRMRIDSHAVVLAPANVALGDLETKIFPVEKSVFGETNVDNKTELQSFFESRSVTFPQGAKIVYVSLLSRLVVTNTADNLNKVREIIQMLQEDREPLVEITAKFVEVNQDNLKELGFNYSISYNTAEVSKNDSQRLSFSGVSDNRQVSDAKSGEPVTPMLNFIGASGDGSYTASVMAANRAESSDALASPRIVTLPNMPAHIEMVKKQPFVDEYDDPEWSEGSGTDSQIGNNFRTFNYKGAFPSFQDPTDLGIIMDVEPKVDKVSRKITLQVKPVVRTLIDYLTWESSQSDATISTDSEKTYMRKPIFANRTLDTTVTVKDGRTIVLGGAVEDTTNTINDKIPILGDLPLIGRFFQSRGTSANKSILLIFITCRLLNPDGTPYGQRSEQPPPNGLPDHGRLN